MDGQGGQGAGTCPVMHGKPTAARFTTRSNRDWWPNSLNLRILSQQSAKSNPMAAGFDYREEVRKLDVAALKNAFGVTTAPVYCTKIASKMVRTFTDRHGLKYLLQDLVGVDVSKQQQTSD